MSQSDCDVDTDDPSNFSTIISRTQRRKRQQQERDRSIQLSAPISAPSATGGRAPSLSGAKSRPLIIGHSITAALKASKTLYVKKSVYRIGNVDAIYTADNLRDYIETCGVRVTSCSDRTSINARTNDNKTFRVCILDMDREKLLSPDNWAVGISIQKWIFKPKENIDEEEGDDDSHISKRPRDDTDAGKSGDDNVARASALINRPSLTVTNNDAGGSRMEVSGGAAVEDN